MTPEEFTLISTHNSQWLRQLQALAIEALLTGDWNPLEVHIAQKQDALCEEEEGWEVVTPTTTSAPGISPSDLTELFVDTEA